MDKRCSLLQTLVSEREDTFNNIDFRIEKDTVISNLTKQVDSLRRRQEKTQNEQVPILSNI